LSRHAARTETRLSKKRSVARSWTKYVRAKRDIRFSAGVLAAQGDASESRAKNVPPRVIRKYRFKLALLERAFLGKSVRHTKYPLSSWRTRRE